MRLIMVIALALLTQVTNAQSAYTPIQKLADKIPAMVVNIDSAWQLFSKEKITAYDVLQKQVKQELNELTIASDNKSYSLAHLNGTLKRNVDYFMQDFRDKNLWQKQSDESIEINRAFDAYTRAGNDANRFLSQKEKISKSDLQQYQNMLSKAIMELRASVTGSIAKLESYMLQKGLLKIIADKSNSNPAYIASLEARGFMLDKILQLNEVTRACSKFAADWIDACKKTPEACG